MNRTEASLAEAMTRLFKKGLVERVRRDLLR